MYRNFVQYWEFLIQLQHGPGDAVQRLYGQSEGLTNLSALALFQTARVRAFRRPYCAFFLRTRLDADTTPGVSASSTSADCSC